MNSVISKYWIFSINVIKERYAYRFREIMWSFTALITMLIQYFLWSSIYQEVNGEFMGVSKENYIAYITFGVMFHTLTQNFEYRMIASDIKSGNILMNLTKPMNYKVMVFFRNIGSKIAEMVGLLPLILCAILLCRDYILDGKTAILFGISTLLAFVISFYYAYIVGLLAFWTVNFWGVHLLSNALMMLFSGQLIGINFYMNIGRGIVENGSTITILHSSGVQVFFRVLAYLSYALPFQSIYYTPMSIFSQIITIPRDIYYPYSLLYRIRFPYLLDYDLPIECEE